MMTEIQINGLKISGELCLIRLHHSTPDIHRLPAFCGIMAGSQINLPFISTAHQASGIQAACCVDAEYQTMIKQLVDADPMMKGHVSYIPGRWIADTVSTPVELEIVRAVSARIVHGKRSGSGNGVLHRCVNLCA